MSRITGRKSRTAAPVALIALLACLLLAACGSSSKSSSTSNAASTSPSTTAGTAGTKPGGAAGAKRFTAVRECLQKNGITLPKRTPGQRPGGGAGGAGGLLGGGTGNGPTLPKGVTRAQYEAAIKKCGGFGGGRFGAGAGTSRFSSPAVKQALSKFASCMRENGVNLPTPNTSGKGPVFNTKGLEPTSTKFKAAQTKCASDLVSAFRARPGAGAPAGTGTPPGSAG